MQNHTEKHGGLAAQNENQGIEGYNNPARNLRLSRLCVIIYLLISFCDEWSADKLPACYGASFYLPGLLQLYPRKRREVSHILAKARRIL